MSINTTEHRVNHTCSYNLTGLVKWVWTRYLENYGMTLRVVTIYPPYKSTQSGMNSTYTQQERYVAGRQDDILPCQDFFDFVEEC